MLEVLRSPEIVLKRQFSDSFALELQAFWYETPFKIY